MDEPKKNLEVSKAPNTAPMEENHTNGQMIDVVAPPKYPKQPESTNQHQTETLPEEAHKKPVEQVRNNHAQHQGIGSSQAIVATIIIVVALAALATFAFIKTKAN